MGTSNLFGLYLRRVRVRHKKSLDEVARALGVTPTYLGEVERGVRPTLPKKYWGKLEGVLLHIDPLALDIFYEISREQVKRAKCTSHIPMPIDVQKLREKYVLSPKMWKLLGEKRK